MNNPIRKYRETHGISQVKVAKLLKVSRAMVSHLEAGRRQITPEHAIQWEKKLGVPREKLCKIFRIRRG